MVAAEAHGLASKSPRRFAVTQAAIAFREQAIKCRMATIKPQTVLRGCNGGLPFTAVKVLLSLLLQGIDRLSSVGGCLGLRLRPTLAIHCPTRPVCRTGRPRLNLR